MSSECKVVHIWPFWASSLSLMLLVFGPCCCIQSMKLHNGEAHIRKACIKSSSKSKQIQTGFIWWEYFSQCCSSSMHPMSPRLFLLWSWSVCVTVVALCVWHHCNVFCAKETLAQRERERVSETLSMFKKLSTEMTYVVCRCQSRNGSCCSAFFPKAHIIWANSKTCATTSQQESQCSKNDRSECKSGLQA